MKASIIIPTFNNDSSLRRTLESLCQQTATPSDFEILVCDNGSIDNTKKETLCVKGQYPQVNIKYFYEPEPGSLSARHRGYKESRTDNILIFTDDDVLYKNNWLETIIDFFDKNPDAHMLGGPSFPVFETNPPKWLEYLYTRNEQFDMCGNLSLLNIKTKLPIEIDPNWIWSLNLAIRKDIFKKCRGLHLCVMPKEYQHFQGDGETGLTLKFKEKGYKAFYHPDVCIEHVIQKSRLTFNFFDNRYFYQGVCNSFTDIRKEYGRYGKSEKSCDISQINIPGRRTLSKIKRKLQNITSQQQISNEPSYEEQLLKTRFNEQLKAGYNFHQWAVKNNSELLKWVLKEDYFDYTLPDITPKYKANKSCY